MRADREGDGVGASSSRGDRGGVGFLSCLARPTQTMATLDDLARALDKQEAEMQGLKYWLMQKTAHDHGVSKVPCARINQISLLYGMDPSTFPQMTPFPDQLSQPLVPAEPPCQDEDED